MDLTRYRRAIDRTDPVRLNGRVSQVVGVIVESIGPAAAIGEICLIHTSRNTPPIPAEVVAFRDNRVLLMPLAGVGQIAHGSEVVATGRPLTIQSGPQLLGRVLDPLGEPLDDKGILVAGADVPIYGAAGGDPTAGGPPPHPLRRQRIRQPLALGVRSLDAFLTCGKGQRLGIFSGSGVGKSTLLGMIARNSTAGGSTAGGSTAGGRPSVDVNVIGLIGERGREVREFIEDCLGASGPDTRGDRSPGALPRSVLVVATSDRPAIQRVKAAFVATAIAEHFRDQGLHVLLTIDSLTRIAWAQREIGLAIGEPPTTRGYTPSVFALLPRLLERAGAGESGSITALYTVLVEGDDLNEPVADTARSILDGHIVLSRRLAEQSHYPAVDVLASISRLMPNITTDQHRSAADSLRHLLATYRSAEDLINIGAYTDGTNPDIDRAKSMIDSIRGFLVQRADDHSDWDHTIAHLQALARTGTAGFDPPHSPPTALEQGDRSHDGRRGAP